MSYVFYSTLDPTEGSATRWYGSDYTVEAYADHINGPSDCWFMIPPTTWECE